MRVVISFILVSLGSFLGLASWGGSLCKSVDTYLACVPENSYSCPRGAAAH